LPYVHFSPYPDSEQSLHIVGNPPCQRRHLAPGRPAEIHENEGLPVVYARPAERLSFPSGLFDEPSGRYLDAVPGRVGGHVGVLPPDSFGVFRGDDRILEEAARVARYGRVGQFRGAYPPHGRPYALRRGG